MANDERQDLNPYIQMRPERKAPRFPMPELDAVDWALLEDAYGPATAVPELIRALSSPDPKDRSWALEGLGACIHHQGSVYSGSTAAVPFLVTLAQNREVENRHEILHLLAGIAVHEPDACLVNGAFQYRSEAYDTVRESGSTFLALLDDPDPAVQTAAAFVLCFLEPPPEGCLETLTDGFDKVAHPHSRACRAMALGYVSRYLESRTARDLLSSLLDDDAEVVRFGAAVGLAQMEGMGLGSDAKISLEACYQSSKVSEEAGFWPWLGNDLPGHARIIRESVITDDELLARMADAKLPEQERDHAARKCVYRLLRADRDRLHQMVAPDELNAKQHELLDWLADHSGPNDYDYEFFERQGLPDTHAQLLRFIGREAGGSDQTLSIDGRQLPGWFAIRETMAGQIEAETLFAAVRDLGPANAVSLVADALDGPWHLAKPRGGTPYGEPQAMAAFESYIDRFIELVADLVTGLDEAGLTWAKEEGVAQADLGEKRKPVIGLVVAIVLGRNSRSHGDSLPEDWDPLLALDQTPAGTHLGAMRLAFEFVPLDRRERLLADRPLFSYTAHDDPDGTRYSWHNEDGWSFLPLLPAEVSAARVIAAWLEWDRHKRGVGTYAEHTAGGVSSTLRQRPTPDQPFPEDRAMAVLAEGGSKVVAALEAALDDPDLEHRQLLEQALDKSRKASLH